MSWVLGIDLGTSFTAAGVVAGPRLEPLPLGAHSSAIPSAVYTGDSGMVVGDAAIVRGDTNPTRLVVEFKRQLGDSSPILAGDEFVSAETLEGALGAWVFQRACELEGSAPSRVVFTFPAFWGAYRRDLFLTLARDIVRDSDLVTLVTEPEAAAAFYASRDRLAVGSIVGVYDLGGGTFDASILQKTQDGFTVLGRPAGDDELGGADLDRALLEYVTERAGVPWADLDRADQRIAREMLHLRRNVTLAKELLSHELSTEVAVAIASVDTAVRLTRRELEQLAEPMITRTIVVFEKALAYASVGARDLHSILLVGAASRMPRIAEKLGGHFGVPLALDSHPKFAICLGAAISSPSPGTAPLPLPPPRGGPLAPPDGRATAAASSGAPPVSQAGRPRWFPAMIVALVVTLLGAGTAAFFLLRGGGSSARTYSEAVLAARPWGYWRLDEHDGGRLVDASKGGPAGTVQGGLTRNQQGVVATNAATAFDGSSGCAVIDAGVNPKTFSLEAWFKTSTKHGGGIIGLSAEPGPVANAGRDHDRHVYVRDDGRVSFGVFHGQSIETTAQSYNDGKWHQVVAVIGPAGQKLYLDGNLVATSPYTTVEDYQGYWHIGCATMDFWPDKPTSNYLAGTVDEVAVYTTELPASAIAEHFRLATPPAG